MTSTLLFGLAVACTAAWIGERAVPKAGAPTLSRLVRWCLGDGLPIVLGVITAILIARMFHSLDAPGGYHDERAYLVQARLLAGFSWSAPAPPVPMAWEMAHVFVEPRIFAKYPPGHAFFLVPGIWLGVPILGPVVLAGVAAGLIVSLVRRFSDTGTAALSWALWTGTPGALDWHASYFSESTTAVLWLAALHLLLSWHREGLTRWLVALVVAVAWMGITRPVVALALAFPVAVVVVRESVRRRAFRQWVPSAAAGVLVIAIIPYWNWTTTGSVAELPYSSYSRHYFPFDMPGFTRDRSAPLRQLPPDLEALGREAQTLYRDHTPGRVPSRAFDRAGIVAQTSLGPVFWPLVVFVPLGLLMLRRGVAVFIVASWVAQVAAYLVMPHAPNWTIYYVEILWVVPALAALGLAWLSTRARRVLAARGRRWFFVPSTAHLAFAAGVLLVLEVPKIVVGVQTHRLRMQVRQLVLADLVAQLEDPRAVIFVRRDARLSPHHTVHDILGPPATTPTWIVRELDPASNAALLEAAGDRRALLFDELRMTLEPLPTSALPHHEIP